MDGLTGITALEAEMKDRLAAKDAEIERLTKYRARMEEAHSAKLYAIEKLLDHFDDDGNLKGEGQWRIREIWQCCKDFDEGRERAAKLSGDSLLAALAEANRRLEAADSIEFGDVIFNKKNGEWCAKRRTGMLADYAPRRASFAESWSDAIAAGWLKPPTPNAAAPQEDFS